MFGRVQEQTHHLHPTNVKTSSRTSSVWLPAPHASADDTLIVTTTPVFTTATTAAAHPRVDPGRSRAVAAQWARAPLLARVALVGPVRPRRRHRLRRDPADREPAERERAARGGRDRGGRAAVVARRAAGGHLARPWQPTIDHAIRRAQPDGGALGARPDDRRRPQLDRAPPRRGVRARVAADGVQRGSARGAPADRAPRATGSGQRLHRVGRDRSQLDGRTSARRSALRRRRIAAVLRRRRQLRDLGRPAHRRPALGRTRPERRGSARSVRISARGSPTSAAIRCCGPSPPRLPFWRSRRRW